MAIANSLALLLYLVCSVTLIRHFVQSGKAQALALPVGLLTVLALIFHGADIFFTMRAAGGWDVSLFSTMTVAAWVMAFIAYLLGLKGNAAHPGILIYPLVALTLILKSCMPITPAEGLSSPALEWHILLSLTAYSLFTLAAIQAIVLAIQERQIRQRQLASIMRQLPPLQSMETSLFQLISGGFILLTIGLITGFVFLNDIFAQHLAHKTVLSLIAWCVFATLLWGRWQYGWRGQTAIKWTLVGFLFLVLAYFGSKFVLEFILSQS
jgi:ABC-type uncharacterized transport system permease subunit